MIYSELNKAGKIDESFRLIRLVNRVTWGALLAFRAHDDAGEARQFLIMKDSVSVAGFRRLSVFLRWQKKRH